MTALPPNPAFLDSSRPALAPLHQSETAIEVSLSYVPSDDIASLREKGRRRAYLVRVRTKLRVKIKAQLTFNGFKTPSEHGLFTTKGLEWLHSLQLDPVESYLPIIQSLDVQKATLQRTTGNGSTG